MIELQKLKEFYENELKNDVIPFWLKNGVDYEYGGFITSLDQKGEIFNYDKSVWFQGRALWMFSKMINTYGPNEEYQKASCRFPEWKNQCRSILQFFQGWYLRHR